MPKPSKVTKQSLQDGNFTQLHWVFWKRGDLWDSKHGPGPVAWAITRKLVRKAESQFQHRLSESDPQVLLRWSRAHLKECTREVENLHTLHLSVIG